MATGALVALFWAVIALLGGLAAVAFLWGARSS